MDIPNQYCNFRCLLLKNALIHNKVSVQSSQDRNLVTAKVRYVAENSIPVWDVLLTAGITSDDNLDKLVTALPVCCRNSRDFTQRYLVIALYLLLVFLSVTQADQIPL